MIFFHGTLEENLKKIKKHGLLNLTSDQWIYEVVQQNVCCISSQPTSGEGGNASFFAYGSTKVKNQNGYLVVVELPKDIFEQKRITIFDNKVLDDYVRYHFFIREEFRNIGYALYQTLTDYQKSDSLFKRLSDHLISTHSEITYDQDQSRYYKSLYKGEKKYFSLLGVVFTQEFYDFIQHVGNWESIYQFLKFHFSKVDNEQWSNLQESSPDNASFWKNFYQNFPVATEEVKHKYIKKWFSPDWLKTRQEKKITHNSQILTQQIEHNYIKGFIKITTPSGFAERFRSCRSGAGFAKEVWREVNKL